MSSGEDGNKEKKNSGSKKMRTSAKTAVGGISAALSVVVMLLSAVVPFLEYALPAAASWLITMICLELDKKWAFATYVSVSLLSLMMLTNKETAMMYVSFFGYYPILKLFFEEKINRKWVIWILKIIVFNASVFAAYYILIKLFAFRIEDLTENGVKGLVTLDIMMNVMFVCYEIALSKFIMIYLKVWQKKFRRIFKN